MHILGAVAKRGQRTFFVFVWIMCESFAIAVVVAFRHVHYGQNVVCSNAIFGKLVVLSFFHVQTRCAWRMCVRCTMRMMDCLSCVVRLQQNPMVKMKFDVIIKLFPFCFLSFSFQLAIAMDSRINASSTRACTIWLVTVAIVWTVRLIVTDRIVSDAKKTTICDQIIIVFTAVAIQSVHVQCNVIPKADASANRAWRATSVIDVMSIFITLVCMDVKRVAVTHVARSTIRRHVTPTREHACARIMLKDVDAKSANRVSSVWIWKISSVAHRASAMATHPNARVLPVIRSYLQRPISTNTRNDGQPSTNTIGRSTLNTINLVRVSAHRPKAMNSFTSWHQIVSWAINGHRTIVCWNSVCN